MNGPYRFSETPIRPRTAAPALGADTDEILREWPRSRPAPAALAEEPGFGELPLEGIVVTDLCWQIAGPSTTRLLADFGATVTKVESNARLDNIRWIGVKPEGEGAADVDHNVRSQQHR